MNEEIESRTIVVYNEKLELFIKEMKENLDLTGLFMFDSFDEIMVTNILKTQDEVRVYIYQNQHKLDLQPINGRFKIEQTFNSCPDYFAIMLCILGDFTICNCFTDILDQIKRLDHKPVWEWNGHEEQDPVKYLCACSQNCSPENMYFLRNQWTRYNLFIGCNCVTKTKILSPEEVKELQKKINGPKENKSRKEKEEKKKKKEEKQKKKEEANKEKEIKKQQREQEKKRKEEEKEEKAQRKHHEEIRKLREEIKKNEDQIKIRIEMEKREEEEKKKREEKEKKRREEEKEKEKEMIKSKTCVLCRTYYPDGNFDYNEIKMLYADIVYLKREKKCYKCLCIELPKFSHLNFRTVKR